MKLRPGTTDQCVYDEVIGRNCYRVPESLEGEIVIDVGAHCGFFSKFCLDRGARVAAFELEPENVAILRENLSKYYTREETDIAQGESFDWKIVTTTMRVRIFNKAVWKVGGIKVGRSGAYMTADGTLKNTGSSHVTSIIPGPHTVEGGIETITLDEILEPFERVAIVKLDCEGAEFEIIPATKSWAKVDRLVGEVHGYRKEYHVPDFYMEIKRHFSKLEVVSSCPEYGLDVFFASK